jgi:prepilin-type N-terminal cleavage/methylation domain-containing protein
MFAGTLSPARRAAGDQRGFTLPELLVALVLGLMVIGTGVMVFSASIRTQPKQQQRGSAIQQARTATERLTRELRQGVSVSAATSSSLSIVTYVSTATCGGSSPGAAKPCRVTYSCTSGACSRVEALPNGLSPGPSQTVMTGLTSSAVFSYLPSTSAPTYVGVTFSFTAENGDDAITVQDGATLRNAGTS